MEKNNRKTKSEMRPYTHLASLTDDEKTLCGRKRRSAHVVNRWCVGEVVCRKCLAAFGQEITIHLASLDEEGETLCGEKVRAGTSIVNRWCMAEVTCSKCRPDLKPETIAQPDKMKSRAFQDMAGKTKKDMTKYERHLLSERKRNMRKSSDTKPKQATRGKLQAADSLPHLASFDVQGETLCGESTGHPAVTLVSRIKYMHHRFNRDKVCQACRDSLTDTS